MCKLSDFIRIPSSPPQKSFDSTYTQKNKVLSWLEIKESKIRDGGREWEKANFITYLHCTCTRPGLLSVVFIKLNYWANQKVWVCQLPLNSLVFWGSYCQCLFKYGIYLWFLCDCSAGQMLATAEHHIAWNNYRDDGKLEYALQVLSLQHGWSEPFTGSEQSLCCVFVLFFFKGPQFLIYCWIL